MRSIDGHLLRGRPTVHVWDLRVSDLRAEVGKLYGLLDHSERQRADGFHCADAGIVFVIARACLRMVLAAYAGIAPDQIAFRYGLHGKPALDLGPDLSWIEFNVSHAADQILIAVNDGAPVGIDVEQLSPEFVSPSLIAATCTDAERSALALLAQPLRDAGFYKLWTSKEAYLKALGLGLSKPLHALQVCIAPACAPRLVHSELGEHDENELSLYGLPSLEGMVSALAARSGLSSVAHFSMPILGHVRSLGQVELKPQAGRISIGRQDAIRRDRGLPGRDRHTRRSAAEAFRASAPRDQN